MSGLRAAGPGRVDVRIVEQKDPADAKDHRIECGFRPSVILGFNIAKAEADSTILVHYDGFESGSPAVARGGVKWKGGGAPAFVNAPIGITIEDNGYVIGSDADFGRAAGARLILIAFGPDVPMADLSETNAVDVLEKAGGFGTGKTFDYDSTPPKYDWIGTTA